MGDNVVVLMLKVDVIFIIFKSQFMIETCIFNYFNRVVDENLTFRQRYCAGLRV